ncbi:sensor histidine kinase [Robinsoniella sp. KNHs210]|uniref:sensor histidine kinase n=1 Tax=Robinsoniella sp. KNHs210 TaxID=1469950 RepID=UPI0009E0772F|nr:histidine kinase [Robinsoniella sp. KNHs210]
MIAISEKNRRKVYAKYFAQALNRIRMEKEPIVKKLFRTYIFWIIICIFVILCSTVLYAGNVINSNITETQKQLTLSINQNIENYFQDMNDFSMELIKSSMFRETALGRLPEYYEEGRNTVDLFSNLYLEAYKMIQKKYHVGIITDQNYYIWMGNEYFIERLPKKAPDTYQNLVKDGSAVIKYLEKNEYLLEAMGNRSVTDKDNSKITLSRSFGGSSFFYNGSAILEVQMDADEFTEDMRRLSSSKNEAGLQIHILNDAGDTIFSETELDSKKFLEENDWKPGSFRKNGYYTYVYKIFNSDIYVLYTISILSYYNKLLTFLGITIIFFLIITALMIAVSYRVSREISKPIHEVCHELRKVDLAQGIRYQRVDTDILELDYLSNSIGELNEKLEESMHHIITLKDFEIHSKLLALQAQMQPHFLVNTLTTMGSMAEETKNQDIARMCLNLTQMFRYISAEESEGVRLFEEMKHVNRYVDIMKERFPNAQVDSDIPLEMMNIRVPKLIIQPLVENSFKYCNRSKPHIKIAGELQDGRCWSIKVSDNGAGFSDSKVEEILKKCEESMDGVNSLSTKIDGMGLVNVYVRLQLFYREEVVYEINQEGIVIGGKVL